MTYLCDPATAALTVRPQRMAQRMAWKFEAGEELLKRALRERRKHDDEPPRSPYFNTRVLAIS